MTRLPPPSPGHDWLGLSAEPLPVAEAVSVVMDRLAGGLAVFLGTTRAERNLSGQELVALDYEAFEEMAIAQLRDLARRARERGPVVRLAILHRVGRVEPAAPSVIVAVSTPHRAEAFDICRWIIDTLKSEVAVWKKEIWSDGAGRWVHPVHSAGSDESIESRDQS